MSRWLLVVVLVSGCVLGGRRDRGDPGPSGSGTAGVGRIGDLCGDHADCSSRFCVDIGGDSLPPFCTSECIIAGCPQGMVCRGTVDGVDICGFDSPPSGVEIGGTCSYDLACVTASCIDLVGDSRGAFCTRTCSDRACPQELVCAHLEDGRQLCVPPPPEDSGKVGQSCQTAADCHSGRCIDVDFDSHGPYCTEVCTRDADCPETMGCFAGQDEVFRCLFRTGRASVGSFCTTDADCASGICIDVVGDSAATFCTDSCRGDLDCPPGMRCASLPDLGSSCIY